MTWLDYPLIALLTVTLWAAGIIILYLPMAIKIQKYSCKYPADQRHRLICTFYCFVLGRAKQASTPHPW